MAGKTACMDAVIYALVVQADKPVWERTAPRRMGLSAHRALATDRGAVALRPLEGFLSGLSDRHIIIERRYNRK